MLDDPEALARMGQAGRHLVEERFCPERITAQMKSLYDELLKGGRALRKF